MLCNESNSSFSISIFELPVDFINSSTTSFALGISLAVTTHLAPALAKARTVSIPIPFFPGS